VGLAVGRGTLVLDRGRLEAVTLALGAACVTGLIGLIANPGQATAESLLYLVAIYAPLALVPSREGRGRDDLTTCMDRFERLLLLLAVACILQMGLQLVGGPYLDPITDLVPSNLRVSGYNTTYPLSYGSPIFKSNGMVCLEASFASQFLGLGLVLRLARGRGGWPVPVLVLGLLCTTAGTGIVMVLVGLVVLALGRRPAVLRILAGPGLVALFVAVATPIVATVSARVTEGESKDSSASLRFIQPFTVLGRVWTRSVDTMVLGSGPGSSSRVVRATVGNAALQIPVPLKLLVDYGGLATIAFLIGIGWCLLTRSRWPAVTASLIVAWLLLSSALQQPATDIPLWVLCGLVWSPTPAPEPAHPDVSSLPVSSLTLGHAQ
jgi:hypothetical protein